MSPPHGVWRPMGIRQGNKRRSEAPPQVWWMRCRSDWRVAYDKKKRLQANWQNWVCSCNCCNVIIRYSSGWLQIDRVSGCYSVLVGKRCRDGVTGCQPVRLHDPFWCALVFHQECAAGGNKFDIFEKRALPLLRYRAPWQAPCWNNNNEKDNERRN